MTVTTTGPAIAPPAIRPFFRSAASNRSTPIDNARRGHRLPGEAFDQIVIAPTTGDRAELALAAFFVK